MGKKLALAEKGRKEWFEMEWPFQALGRQFNCRPNAGKAERVGAQKLTRLAKVVDGCWTSALCRTVPPELVAKSALE